MCRGWRAKHVLPELLALLSGETAIRVADPKALDPLELVELEPEDSELQDEDENGADTPEPTEVEPVPSEENSAHQPPSSAPTEGTL